MAPIISTRELSKTFRRKGGEEVVAVSDLTMDIEPGSLTAFLGPNGAGKSTSLRMLTTLLPPTSGHATVCGFDVAREQADVRRSIGYIGQKNGAAQYYRVRDELVSQGAFYGLSRTERRQRADELLEILGLTELATRTTMTLSGGQRRRVDIALGLVPAPRLLFLDEPSTGLDPQSRSHLWDHILTLRERYGMTLFLTTHYLDEADRFAERVMIVDQGRLIADDTAARLKANLAGDRIVLTLAGAVADDGALALLRRVAARGGDVEQAAVAAPEGAAVRCTVVVDHGDRVLPGLLASLAAAGHEVLAAELHQPTLDDVFLGLTGRSLREEQATVEAPAQPALVPGGPQ
ncbi:ATP-binding cassette domain-containing protein [Georgenia phoenicis]|uniref:ATP-binding cassette domain-containing protein n=1 Tax=unclassified Georgenia TaxID=2626815 RepID=UPI0039B086DB